MPKRRLIRPPASSDSMPVNVVWFKRDLRIRDHAPLSEAAKGNDPLILLYLIEPERLAQPDTDPTHIEWELEIISPDYKMV